MNNSNPSSFKLMRRARMQFPKNSKMFAFYLARKFSYFTQKLKITKKCGYNETITEVVC